MTVLEGKVDTYPEIVEVLQCHGYEVQEAEDAVLLAVITDNGSSLAELQILPDGNLIINCEIDQLGNFADDAGQAALTLLWSNAQINPYAVTVLPPADIDDPDAEDLMVVLTDKVTIADMDPGELVAAVENLFEAVQIVEELQFQMQEDV